jgi:hypothetical protein
LHKAYIAESIRLNIGILESPCTEPVHRKGPIHTYVAIVADANLKADTAERIEPEHDRARHRGMRPINSAEHRKARHYQLPKHRRSNMKKKHGKNRQEAVHT